MVWAAFLVQLWSVFFANDAVDGISASFSLFARQSIAVIIIAAYSWFITWLILKLIDRNKDIRIDTANEDKGLDIFELDETAYNIDKSNKQQ